MQGTMTPAAFRLKLQQAAAAMKQAQNATGGGGGESAAAQGRFGDKKP